MPSNIAPNQNPTFVASRRAAAAAQSNDGLQEVVVTAPRDKGGKTGENGKGMSFWDLLDVVNPLQHIPIVNRIYRSVTGDEIGTTAKVAGSGLYFGVVGLAISAADAVVEDMTGKDTLGNALSAVGLGEDDQATGATASRGSASPHAQLTASPPAVSGGPVSGPAPGAPPSHADLIAAGREQQIKELQATPGGSAAAAALSGLPPSAALGMLGAPGAGGGDLMAMASLEGKTPNKEAPKGQGLSRYWQQAVDATPQPLRTYVPPIVNQRALQDRSLPGGEGVLALKGNNTAVQDAAIDLVGKTSLPTATSSTQSAPSAANSSQSQNEDARRQQEKAQNSARPTAAAWPPGGPNPLPPELVADMMSQALNKYQALAKGRQNAPPATTINGAY